MFFIFSKILNFLLMPLTWVMLLMIFSFFWKRHSFKLRLSALVFMFVFGNSFILHEVSTWWNVPITGDDALGEHEIAVVLGGYAYYSPENDRITFRNSSDRLLQALRLYETGKVKHIILSGGSGYLLQPEIKESHYVKDYLVEINVPETDVTMESDSRNTRENAEYTASLLQKSGKDKQRVVLITSAYHMRRSVACFEKLGISVIPYSADPTTGERQFTPDHLIMPNAETFAYWNVLIHEWFGYLSYKLMGYI